MTEERESIKALRRAIDVQLKKSQDYQNPKSTVVQADYYPSGIQTIYEIMHGKMLRIKSLLESEGNPNYESLEDSFIDLINYASFGAAYLKGGIPGQKPGYDMFNRPLENALAADLEEMMEAQMQQTFGVAGRYTTTPATDRLLDKSSPYVKDRSR